MAKRGHQVQVYEMRSDPRLDHDKYTGKSINLAMSERGRSALRRLGIEEEMIESHAIPMRARMIHDLSGGVRVIPYGTRPDHCIYSVSRLFLNQSLLNRAQSHANVDIYFHHKILSVDFESGRSEFLVTSPGPTSTSAAATASSCEAPVHSSPSSSASCTSNGKTGGETLSPAGKFLTAHNEETSSPTTTAGQADERRKVISSSVVIGADGAFSAVRKHLMKSVRMNFSQTFIDHGYMELCIPVTDDNEFAMPANYLHIWPRDQFMMIALPNQDKSFTVTLFMPFASFEAIQTEDHLIQFFEQYFPDSIDLIGRQRLIQVRVI
jgi:2-polyprenyl-6-methoxyphenol hydroxylase-like FAD-dependent oxidoreductase